MRQDMDVHPSVRGSPVVTADETSWRVDADLQWLWAFVTPETTVYAIQPGRGLAQWAPMTVFLLEATLLTPLMGGSFGQLVCRVAVVRVDGKPVNVLHALLRTALICLVVPPLVFNRDQRGLHDLAVKTVTVVR